MHKKLNTYINGYHYSILGMSSFHHAEAVGEGGRQMERQEIEEELLREEGGGGGGIGKRCGEIRGVGEEKRKIR